VRKRIYGLDLRAVLNALKYLACAPTGNQRFKPANYIRFHSLHACIAVEVCTERGVKSILEKARDFLDALRGIGVRVNHGLRRERVIVNDVWVFSIYRNALLIADEQRADQLDRPFHPLRGFEYPDAFWQSLHKLHEFRIVGAKVADFAVPEVLLKLLPVVKISIYICLPMPDSTTAFWSMWLSR